MDNVLLIINMQEYYVGKFRNKDLYNYDRKKLIDNINKRIEKYAPEEVFYVRTVAKGLFKSNMPNGKAAESDIVTGLKVVSKNMYTKSKPNAFLNDALGEFMRARNVKKVEICGVDGGNSVGASAVGGFEYDLYMIYNEACIGTMDTEKEKKFLEKLSQGKSEIINEV
ncbi:isochorismatase family protein [Ruminococcus sp. NK3A76]|uniref:isochorismatase family protein n=1 Tax=Ruminococcus sp. NK3A76 TaxID=877411 RepID=UPI00048BA36F|nr:isochorismatase family protein [Ruminococcus sp. NK3A76]